MRMLGLGPVRAQSSFFRGLARAYLTELLFLKIPAHEKQRDDHGDDETNEIIHTDIFSWGGAYGAMAMEACAETGKHCFLMSCGESE